MLPSPPAPGGHHLLPSSSSSSSVGTGGSASPGMSPFTGGRARLPPPQLPAQGCSGAGSVCAPGPAAEVGRGRGRAGAAAAEAEALTTAAIILEHQPMVIPSRAGASRNGTEHPPRKQPSATLCPAIAPSQRRAPKTLDYPVCVRMGVLQLGTYSPMPYPSRKKGEGLAGLLGFQTCRAAAGPVPCSAFAPERSSGFGWCIWGGHGVPPSSSRVSHWLQPSLENLNQGILLGWVISTCSHKGEPRAPAHPLPAGMGASCRQGFSSCILVSSVAALDAVGLHPTPARTAWGREGGSFSGVDTVAFPPGRLQGLQTGGLHTLLPATAPGTLPALPEHWATLCLAFHHLGTGRARCGRTDRQCPLLLSVPCHQPGTVAGSPLSPGGSLRQLHPGWSGEGCASAVQQMMGDGHLPWHDGRRGRLCPGSLL